MVNLETGRRPAAAAVWSGQFGVNIKGVGVCSFGDEIVFTQGSVEDLRFAAAYGRRGRIVAAITFNGKWLEYYAAMIERSAPFRRHRLATRPRTWSRCRPVSGSASRPGFPMLFSPADPTSRGAEFRPKPLSPAQKRRHHDHPRNRLDRGDEVREPPTRIGSLTSFCKTPVVQVADKVYVVTGYRELLTLAHDPHISSDITKSHLGQTGGGRCARARWNTWVLRPAAQPHRVRPAQARQRAPSGDPALRPPTLPDLIPNMETDIQQLCNEMLDGIKAKGENT